MEKALSAELAHRGPGLKLQPGRMQYRKTQVSEEEDWAKKRPAKHIFPWNVPPHKRKANICSPLQSTTFSTGDLHSLHSRAQQSPFPSFHTSAAHYTHYMEPFGAVIQVKS